jgi:hypothetical protein
MPSRPEPTAIRWHAEVAQAVQAGDATAADRAMLDIVDEATQAVKIGRSAVPPRPGHQRDRCGGFESFVLVPREPRPWPRPASSDRRGFGVPAPRSSASGV